VGLACGRRNAVRSDVARRHCPHGRRARCGRARGGGLRPQRRLGGPGHEERGDQARPQ
jgi:hypothetical protein